MDRISKNHFFEWTLASQGQKLTLHVLAALAHVMTNANVADLTANAQPLYSGSICCTEMDTRCNQLMQLIAATCCNHDFAVHSHCN